MLGVVGDPGMAIAGVAHDFNLNAVRRVQCPGALAYTSPVDVEPFECGQFGAGLSQDARGAVALCTLADAAGTART